MSTAGKSGRPAAALAAVRGLDAGGWRVATWSVPVAFSPALATLFGAGWLLDKWPLHQVRFCTLVCAAAVITMMASLLVGVALLSSNAPRRRAFGLAALGAGVAVFIFAFSYALWLRPLVEPYG